MLWSVMDADGNGVVDMNEFVEFVEGMKEEGGGGGTSTAMVSRRAERSDKAGSPTGQPQLLLAGTGQQLLDRLGGNGGQGTMQAYEQGYGGSSTDMVEHGDAMALVPVNSAKVEGATAKAGLPLGQRMNRHQLQQRALAMDPKKNNSTGRRPEKPSTVMVRERMLSKSADERYKVSQ